MRFIKSNWFILALLLLVLAAIFRNKIRIAVQPPPGQTVQPIVQEKFTENSLATQHNDQMNLFSGGSVGPAANVQPSATEAFLRRFSKTAIAEHKKFGIPASILLAHACISSNAGKSELAQQANDFMALPCGDAWDGATVELQGRCYRQYNTPWESFRDFSIYLAAQDWPASLRQKSGMDWEPWVNAMGKHLNSNPGAYNKTMKDLIMAFRLFELDK
ncbi:MAG: glucosaminidase domain-containing protein [Lewinellaceae bacterium]|nr:glucosaminidase domain-containing protein [Lewinellaceae bacterium]